MINKISPVAYTLFFILSSLLIASCSSEKPREQVISEETEDYLSLNDDVTYILPSPLQIASIFKRSGMTYISGVTNPPSNVDNYTDAFNQSLAVGVYSADLAYSIVNNQTQEALNHLKALKDLSHDLGFANVFETESIISRFENNLGNEDSLTHIISDLQMDMDIYMEENEKAHLAAIIFTGAWIESVYLGAKTIEKGNNVSLSGKVSEQFIILENLIKTLNAKRNANGKILLLITELQNLKKHFDTIANKEESENEPFNIREEDLNKLTSAVQSLRSKIIAGNF